MPDLHRVAIEMSLGCAGQAGDPLPWLVKSMTGYPDASARKFEALAIIVVTLRKFSNVETLPPDTFTSYFSQYPALTALDSALSNPRYQNLRAVKIYVTGVDVNSGK